MNTMKITLLHEDIDALKDKAKRLFREADRLDINGSRCYADAVRAENLREDANRIISRIVQ